MASWKPQEFNINNVNGGVPFENGRGVDADAINKAIEGSAWAIEQSKAQFGYTIRAINAEPSATGYLDGSSITPVGGTKEGDFLLYDNKKLYRVNHTQFAPNGTLATAGADFIFEFKEYASMDDVGAYLGSLRVLVEQLDMKSTDHEERLESLESSSGSSGGTQWYCHSVMFTDSGLPLTFISTRSTAYTRYQDIFIDFANGVLFGVSVDAPNTSYMRYIHMTWDIDFEKEIDYITLYDRNGNAMIVNYTLANYTPTKI